MQYAFTSRMTKFDIHLRNQVGEPVLFWLRELSLVHEAECTIMLQSKPVDPGNFAKRATSITSDVSYSELGHLYNNKSEHMDTGRRCKENKILKV